MGYKLYSKLIKIYFNAKNSKRNFDQFSDKQELSFEYIENGILKKVYSKYSVNADTLSLASAKHFLQQKKSTDEIAEKLLVIIQELETLKYSGAQSSALSSLKERVERL